MMAHEVGRYNQVRVTDLGAEMRVEPYSASHRVQIASAAISTAGLTPRGESPTPQRPD
jgi:hypothetical protein